MKIMQCGLWIFLLLLACGLGGESVETSLPTFGRNTVLVWKIMNEEHKSQFVARIAEFAPDRFIEWEDASTQGTVFISSRDLLTAKDYVNSSLFEAGADSRSRRSTTLWLSRLIYRELKDKGKVKCNMDGVAVNMTGKGEGRLNVEVNKSMQELPVIKVGDDRESERWFLDMEENPLMVKLTFRDYSQTLVSITTDRPNTLRWIKGEKLSNLPR
jgi:hypothetical protein